MKKLLTYLICISAALTFVSCVNLDLNPLSEGSSETWYSSEAEIEMSLNDFYRTDFFPIQGVLWADDIVRRGDAYCPFIGAITAENSTIATRWQNYYKGIARALRILSNLETKGKELGISDAKMQQYKGEAYFYLGFAYGMIAFYWGDAILDKTGMTLDEAYNASRSPKADVLAFAYECLDKAAANLPQSYPGIQRATQGAAYGFKARVALFNHDYAIAADAAKKCMDLKVYKLHDNYADLFTASWSDEWIFYFRGDVALKKYYWMTADNVQDFISRLSGGWGGARAPGLELVCAYPCIDGKPIDESPLYNPKDLFENRDPRMAMTIQPFATPYSKCVLDGTYNPDDYNYLGYEYSPDPTKLTVKRMSDGAQVKNNDSKANAEHASYNGFLFRKSIDASWTENGFKGAPTTYQYLRYGDVLLMYAEAMIEQNKCTQEVLDETINKLRERAYNGTGIPYPKVLAEGSTQAQLRTILRTERYIEMAAEGHRLEDLYRWKIAEIVFNRPIYYLDRAWAGANWDGDESKVSDAYRKLIQNWRDGNYPIGGIPEIDENGVADISGMCEAGYVIKATERTFDKNRDYLWPIPASDRLINSNLSQNPGY